MKVIDLLNKIANGEETPKKININGGIQGIDGWVFDEHYEDYRNGADELLLYSGMTSNHLNDEVEIINEQEKLDSLKKIEKLKSNGKYFYSQGIECWIDKENTSAYCECLMNKLNEIIDYIKKGDSNE